MFSVILLILVAGMVARWVLAAYHGGGDGYELAARDAQIKRLREEMDGLHAEVRRLGEEQSFMVRLLSEGAPSGGAALPVPERPQQSNPEMP